MPMPSDTTTTDAITGILTIDRQAWRRSWRIASRWNGVYVKHPTEPYFIARPAAGVTVVTGVGGAWMTLSFGLAEKIVKENLGGS